MKQLLLALLLILPTTQASAEQAAPSILDCFEQPSTLLAQADATSLKKRPRFITPKKTKRIKLGASNNITSFKCERNFTQNGKTQSIDSYYSQNAERLRHIVKDVPLAISELNEYQRSQRNVKIASYTGTLGLLIIAGGLIAADSVSSTNDAIVIRNVTTLGGTTLAASSFIYSFSVLRSNEARLENISKYYNQSNPKNPIQLKFSTDFFF